MTDKVPLRVSLPFGVASNSMERTIAVFGASQSRPGDGHYEMAVRCGMLLAEAGFAVATGGYAGSMEAVSLGAQRAGGHVIGITAPTVFPGRPGGNEHLTTEMPAETLVERIGLLIDGSDGSIALWGSLGTAAEMIVAWNLAYVAPLAGRESRPVIAVGEPWLTLVPHLESSLETAPGLVTVVNKVDDAVKALTDRLMR